MQTQNGAVPQKNRSKMALGDGTVQVPLYSIVKHTYIHSFIF